MRQTITVTTAAPSILVIQRAYHEFCAPSSTPVETIYDVDGSDFPLIDAAKQQTALATSPPVEDWLKFKQLVADWRQQGGAMSSITEAALCPAYQGIIGMGQLAVPFILAQLESEGDEPDQWFWALRAITGANPVVDADRGNYPRMAQAWIQWGKDNGYAR